MRAPAAAALVLVTVLALGGVAHADPGEGVATDACRAQGAPDAACDSVRAVSWGVAAACRALGGPDAACGVADGRAIGEAQVAAYESGWVARAHAAQRSLQATVPFGDGHVVATHNSANATAYPFTPSRYDANQTYAMTEQLRFDVRRLELDVHWWFDTATGARAPVLCHASREPYAATGIDTPPTRHAGCSAEFPLAVGLAEIAAWLDQHPDEVVMLRFETHLETPEAYATAAAQLAAAFGERLWKRAADAGACPALPLDATFAEVRAAGAQVVAVGDCGPAGGAWGALTYRYDHAESTYRGTFDAATCGPHFDGADYASTWVRYFEDATWISSLRSAAGGGPAPLDGATAAAMAACGVNEVSLDHLTPDDGRLEALVWTWAADEDADAGEDCAALDGNGRFASQACSEARAFACRDGAGAFTLTDTSGPWQQGATACAALGAALAVPHTPFEAAQLAATAAGAQPWIAYARHDGTWSAPSV